MPIDIQEFLSEYSRALRAGVASLFVGAGLSMRSGLPSWDALLRPMRAAADVPDSVRDPTVVAEHISHHFGDRKFQELLLTRLLGPVAPSLAHRQIAGLSFKNIWTTNYDTLIEDSHASRFVILSDSGYSDAKRVPHLTRIVKLHGSLGIDENNLVIWRAAPVITRTDFESYTSDHPLFWADLTASFLTSTFLFVGFSFDDPNIEVLLRLSRTIRPEIRRSPHFTIMRRPDASEGHDAVRGHELRVADLERTGIFVVEIESHDDLDVLLEDLLRLSQPPSLFVAGSRLTDSGTAILQRVAESLAAQYADWNMVSLGGPASYEFATGMKRGMGADYNAERIRFYFRESDDGDFVPRPNERVGTAVYSQQTRDVLLPRLLGASRAVLVIGGAVQTAEEVELAAALGLPIIPIPVDGGTAVTAFDNWSKARADAGLEAFPVDRTEEGWVEFVVQLVGDALAIKPKDE